MKNRGKHYLPTPVPPVRFSQDSDAYYKWLRSTLAAQKQNPERFEKNDNHVHHEVRN